MKILAIVPTKNRPANLRVAIESFLTSCSDASVDVKVIVISDDSTEHFAVSQNLELCTEFREKYQSTKFVYLHPKNETWESGAGNARNRGINWLRKHYTEREYSVCFFDDDVCFSKIEYNGYRFETNGSELIDWVSKKKDVTRCVIGCSYLGFQDLSTLEHIQLASERKPEKYKLNRSQTRGDIENEAPGKISGAFLFVPGSCSDMPLFPKFYNEDYFWLRKLELDGWTLIKAPFELIHVPMEEFIIRKNSLIKEQYGELLWCAANRFLDEKDTQLSEIVDIEFTERMFEIENTLSLLSNSGFNEAYMINSVKKAMLVLLDNAISDTTDILKYWEVFGK